MARIDISSNKAISGSPIETQRPSVEPKTQQPSIASVAKSGAVVSSEVAKLNEEVMAEKLEQPDPAANTNEAHPIPLDSLPENLPEVDVGNMDESTSEEQDLPKSDIKTPEQARASMELASELMKSTSSLESLQGSLAKPLGGIGGNIMVPVGLDKTVTGLDHKENTYGFKGLSDLKTANKMRGTAGGLAGVLYKKVTLKKVKNLLKRLEGMDPKEVDDNLKDEIEKFKGEVQKYQSKMEQASKAYMKKTAFSFPGMLKKGLSLAHILGTGLKMVLTSVVSVISVIMASKAWKASKAAEKNVKEWSQEFEKNDLYRNEEFTQQEFDTLWKEASEAETSGEVISKLQEMGVKTEEIGLTEKMTLKDNKNKMGDEKIKEQAFEQAKIAPAKKMLEARKAINDQKLEGTKEEFANFWEEVCNSETVKDINTKLKEKGLSLESLGVDTKESLKSIKLELSNEKIKTKAHQGYCDYQSTMDIMTKKAMLGMIDKKNKLESGFLAFRKKISTASFITTTITSAASVTLCTLVLVGVVGSSAYLWPALIMMGAALAFSFAGYAYMMKKKPRLGNPLNTLRQVKTAFCDAPRAFRSFQVEWQTIKHLYNESKIADITAKLQESGLSPKEKQKLNEKKEKIKMQNKAIHKKVEDLESKVKWWENKINSEKNKFVEAGWSDFTQNTNKFQGKKEGDDDIATVLVDSLFSTEGSSRSETQELMKKRMGIDISELKQEDKESYKQMIKAFFAKSDSKFAGFVKDSN